MKLAFLAIIFLFVQNSSSASTDMLEGGDEKGNGGLIVNCYDLTRGIDSYQTLDTYEAQRRYNANIIVGKSKQNVDRVMDIFLEEITIYMPHLSKILKEYYRTFWHEAMFLKDVNLVDTNDSYHAFLEDHCEIKQAIVQQTPIIDGDPRYYVDVDIWGLLPVYERAVLILHEMVYRYLNTPSSLRVRRFISMILSKELDSKSLQVQLKSLRSLGFSKFVNNEISLDLSHNVLFRSPESILGGYSVKDSFFRLWGSLTILGEAEVRFYENGIPMFLCIRNNIKYYSPSGDLFVFTPDRNHSTNTDCSVLELYDSGAPLSGFGYYLEPNMAPIKGKFFFRPNGEVIKASETEDTVQDSAL